MDSKKKPPLKPKLHPYRGLRAAIKNGIILAVIAIFFIVYFSVKDMWGIAQVVIIIILALMSAFQFYIYNMGKKL